VFKSLRLAQSLDLELVVREFFFAYGLFTAKLFTLVLGVVLGLGLLAIILSSRSREQESISIEKINDRLDAMREALESELLTKAEYKALQKERNKKEKKKEKALKKNLSESKDPPQKRMFLVKFLGDLQASEVDNLREAITALLSVATTNDEVLIILESSGGLVHTYGLAASQLMRIRARHIPLTVAVDLVAASGGYMMACVANKIIAAPFAIVGSIGVLAQIPNFNRFLEKHDIDVEQHTAGKYKTTLTMLGRNTDKAREKFREELEDTHDLFKTFVNTNRPQIDIEKIATGEHWYGAQALDLQLIDEVLTSDDYILEKSKDTDIFEITYIINETLKEKLFSFLQNSSLKLCQKVVNIMGKLIN